MGEMKRRLGSPFGEKGGAKHQKGHAQRERDNVGIAVRRDAFPVWGRGTAKRWIGRQTDSMTGEEMSSPYHQVHSFEVFLFVM